MPRPPAPRWSALSWEVLTPASRPAIGAEDVTVRLASPRLPGQGRLLVRFGVRRTTVTGPDGEPLIQATIPGPTGVEIESASGGFIGADTLAALRDVPLASLIASARGVVEDYLVASRVDAEGRPVASDLDIAIERARSARRHPGGARSEAFRSSIKIAIAIAREMYPEAPIAYIASELGVAQDTAQRWAAAAKEPPTRGKKKKGGRK